MVATEGVVVTGAFVVGEVSDSGAPTAARAAMKESDDW